uniref:imidazolonepropionase n=1 Tax=Oryzias melastigma TaxID=30732 RepID=A0A3B3CZ59_ORYME
MSGNQRLLVKNAKQLVLICSNGEKFLNKDGMKSLSVIENGSVVIGRDGLIKSVGPAETISAQYPESSFDRVIDATDMCVLPGLVDAHTHPVWAGDRVHEFSMKVRIHFTVEHTRAAAASELLDALTCRLWRMLRAGTTLVECKSGYGLELQTEVKMLEVIEAARRSLPLPRLKELMSAGSLQVDNIDVFCERGVFGLSSAHRILQAGRDMGLNINFHGDELHPMNSAQMGAELGALAISHLEEVTDEGIVAMATAKTAAILLPTTAYILRLPQPRARDMLDAGVIVALGSDFNPNAFCCSMPIVMHLACVNMRMTMSEALAAATINAAYALGRQRTHGSLEVDKHGDLLILNCCRWEHLIYQLGGHQELIRYVVVKGNVVHDNTMEM